MRARRALLEAPGDLVIRHIDELGPQQTHVLAGVLAEARASRVDKPRGSRDSSGQPWVGVTLTRRDGTPNLTELLRLFPGTVALPPLRHHIEDLPDLTRFFLGRLSQQGRLSCSPEAMKLLVRSTWPGNVEQLWQVMRRVVQRRRVGAIMPRDLPPECWTVSRRLLSPLEAMERDAIVQSLLDTDGIRHGRPSRWACPGPRSTARSANTASSSPQTNLGRRASLMPAWICVTCGVQHADTQEPPGSCAICTDERQYVGWTGQQWTTMARLAADHQVVLREEEPGLMGIGVEPPVAIGQRALLVCTPEGNVLWDCVPLLDGAARARITELGGIAAICMSHPHFYAANVEFAEAFGARILIPRADQQWIRRPSPRIELFGDTAEPVPGLTLARIGGHFDGAAVLHWPAGSQGRGVLLTGDTITVVPDRDWVSFMWSYPNLIPLDEATVLAIADRVSSLRFDRVYGGWWGRIVLAGGAAAVRRSADRYVARLRGERPAAG